MEKVKKVCDLTESGYEIAFPCMEPIYPIVYYCVGKHNYENEVESGNSVQQSMMSMTNLNNMNSLASQSLMRLKSFATQSTFGVNQNPNQNQNEKGYKGDPDYISLFFGNNISLHFFIGKSMNNVSFLFDAKSDEFIVKMFQNEKEVSQTKLKYLDISPKTLNKDNFLLLDCVLHSYFNYITYLKKNELINPEK